MRSTLNVTLVVALVFVPSIAFADSWAEFRNFRQVEATGRFYLVVKKGEGAPEDPGRGTPITFEIAERKPDTQPVADSTDQADDDGRNVHNPDVAVRPGDTIRGRGKLDRCPAFLIISSTGMGFVGIDVRGYNYALERSGDAVVTVNTAGKVIHRKNLVDLFSRDEIAGFEHSAGGVQWAGGGWIDDRRKEAVVVSAPHHTTGEHGERLIRIVSLERGDVRKGSVKQIVTALADRNRGALDFALELAAELKLKDALKDAAAILADTELPPAARLRAAVALATFGDKRGADLLSKAALEKSSDQEYAIQNLPVALGDKAATILCDVIRRFGERCYADAWQAMSSISGEAAVPELARLLDENESVTSQTFAAECLGDRGPAAKTAVPGLVKLLVKEPTRRSAAEALGEIGPDAKAALPDLIRLAEVHAKKEWERVKGRNPESRPGNARRRTYSSSEIVDAICKIREP